MDRHLRRAKQSAVARKKGNNADHVQRCVGKFTQLGRSNSRVVANHHSTELCFGYGRDEQSIGPSLLTLTLDQRALGQNSTKKRRTISHKLSWTARHIRHWGLRHCLQSIDPVAKASMNRLQIMPNCSVRAYVRVDDWRRRSNNTCKTGARIFVRGLTFLSFSSSSLSPSPPFP